MTGTARARAGPGTPVIVGAGPEQIQQRRPSGFAANMAATMVGYDVNDPPVTPGDFQTFAQDVNIEAVAGAPGGSVLWPTQNMAQLNLDGASPA